MWKGIFKMTIKTECNVYIRNMSVDVSIVNTLDRNIDLEGQKGGINIQET